MRILKIKGKTETQILEEIKREYGDKAVVLSTQEERPKGFRGLFAKSQWILTIAVEDEKEIAEAREVAQPAQVEADKAQPVAPVLHVQQDKWLQTLQQEMATIRDEVKALRTQDTLPKTESDMFGHIRESLVQEGVEYYVIEQILQGTEQCESVEAAAQILYTNLLQLLPMADAKEDAAPVTFFIGSTGVGKTTTIAKLTAESVLSQKKDLVLFTADTYRIAAIEQLRTYADILDVPIETIYSKEELIAAREKWSTKDAIFVDTAGRSHKNEEQMADLKTLLEVIQDKQVYLVLPMNTNHQDVKKIVDKYTTITPDFKLIITKMDETDQIGNLLNIAAYTQKQIAYITTGQNVPDDIKYFDQDTYMKLLLGRIKYE